MGEGRGEAHRVGTGKPLTHRACSKEVLPSGRRPGRFVGGSWHTDDVATVAGLDEMACTGPSSEVHGGNAQLVRSAPLEGERSHIGKLLKSWRERFLRHADDVAQPLDS